MTALARRIETLRAFAHELGPLCWVAVAVAIVPTIGLFVVLGRLPQLAEWWPHATGLRLLLATAAIAFTTGAVLLPPSIASLALGYCFGASWGAAVAVVGLGLGGVVGQRLVWPLLGARVYAFMRSRPRVHLVQAMCAGNLWQQVRSVALLRWAAKFPFAVTNLLLSAARVPSSSVLLGSWLGAAPAAVVASTVGAVIRQWRLDGSWPGAPTVAALVTASAVAALAWALARRRVPSLGPRTE